MAAVDSGSFYPTDTSFKTFLWNSSTNEFLGRTGTSWAKIGIFYLIFYSCLAGFFAIMFAVFYQTLDTKVNPKYTPGDGDSLLKNPALGIRPLPKSDNIESSLIWYKNGVTESNEHWLKSINTFVKPYVNESTSEKSVLCTDSGTKEKDDVCIFKLSWLAGNCNTNSSWGYNDGSPCIILKMNRMIKWEPVVYETVAELPDDMPDELKEHITSKEVEEKIPKMVWVICKGENPQDREYIHQVTYSPWRGFPSYYFPYLNQEGYLSPFLAIEFDIKAHVLINVECSLWAKNIEHNKKRRLGIIHFEFLKD